jgi:tetratricopeptide (TPR) repeat protein
MVVLIAAIVIVYAPVRHYDFVQLDDPKYVSENLNVSHGLTFPGFLWAFTARHGSYWIPLTWLSYMVDVQIAGMNAGALHVTNVLLHIANSLLLFWLLWRMTGGLGRSAFVAALFAVHPLHVESVAWITERKDVLSTLFWLLALWAYVSYVRRPALGRYVMVLVWFALGLMAKPMLVTLPFAFLLLDVWPLGRVGFGTQAAGRSKGSSADQRKVWLYLVREKLPMIALAAAFSVVTFAAQGEALSGLDVFPFFLRVENALVSYVTYLGKTIWPVHLVVLYPFPKSIPAWSAAGAAVVLAIASVLAALGAKRYPYVAVGWLWYLGTLVPVIGLVQAGLQSMADRFTYVPLIGIFIIVAWGAWDLLGRLPYRRIALPAAGVAVVACAVVARGQVRYWKDNVTLWTHETELTLNLDAFQAHLSLGTVLREQGRLDEAAEHFSEAMRIKPDSAALQHEMGLLLAKQGKFDEAIGPFQEAVRLKPDFPEAQRDLGLALSHQGRAGEATDHLSIAVHLKPDSSEWSYELGIALASQGKVDEAIASFQEAVRLKPDFAEAQGHLGSVLASRGKLDEAIAHISEAVRLKPDLADAQNNLGALLASQSRFSEALPHFAEAVRLKPDYELAHRNLGLALARTGRKEEAMQELKKALGMNPADAAARRALEEMSRPGATPRISRRPVPSAARNEA